METFNAQVSFYTKRFAFSEKQFIANPPSKNLKLALVIPAYDEEIKWFLEGLNHLTCKSPNDIEVIIVLNHSLSESEETKTKHSSQLKEFKNFQLSNKIPVHFIPAFDQKPKHAGVGLARKIGMDEAVKRFQEINYPGLIVCLDADCRVAPNYFDSLLKAEREAWSGLSLYYEHPLNDLAKNHQKSIVNYEIFLRYYSLALKSTGYPHYFQTVGSSMACRSDLYCKIGGMNRRKAGEDFYFLHKVFPHGNFKEWTETTVFPSPRKSNRVPFGTGKAMIAEEEGLKDYSLLYNPKIFEELKNFLSSLHAVFKSPSIIENSLIGDFLLQENLLAELKALISRSKSPKGFLNNFYYWFDGFRVMKYLHFTQGNHSPDINNLEACRRVLGVKALDELSLLLELRTLEKQG